MRAAILVATLVRGGCGERARMPLEAPGVTVDHTVFADAGLEAAVRAAVGQPRGVFAAAALAELTALDATERGISDLAGIDRLPRLRQLRLARNRVRDLGPLSALDSLQVLDLSGNQVFSLTALSDLGALTHLNLDFNLLRNVASLRSLVELRVINLNGNRIRDISALVGLRQLQAVELSGNPLAAIALEQHLPALVRRGVQVTLYSPAGQIFIPDLRLEAVIRRAARKNLGNLTREDLDKITSLTIDADDRVTDLRGVNFLRNLRSFSCAIAR